MTASKHTDVDNAHNAAPTCLFVDIGGVLLTDGWNHVSRQKAARLFGLDWEEMEDRHRLTFETYEEGKFTLSDYLNHVVFYRERSFNKEQFWNFMCQQSQPHQDMLKLIAELKARCHLKIAAVSNEARELNSHRIKTFQLDSFIDFFISSCFVHLRKPDPEIFKLALDIANVSADRVVYIENTEMFVNIAENLGIRSIHHTDFGTTCEKLSNYGLQNSEGIWQAS